jgi:GxxExxY protein
MNSKTTSSFVDPKYVDSELTGRIIGCAMRVHAALGNGFQEVIYQRSLSIEMRDDGLAFSREQEMPIFFKGERVGTRRVDFLVEQRISVELKALIELQDVHLAQAINYLEAYNIQTGLLINFGARKLQFHRLNNLKYKQRAAIPAVADGPLSTQ